MSFGVDPSDGPDDAIYSTPLMLRWIARCGLNPVRDRLKIQARGDVHFCSPPAGGGRLVRGGLGVAGYPLSGAPELPWT